VDVLTGIIKANFPARISFQSPRAPIPHHSDAIGAERLLGKDMLFLPRDVETGAYPWRLRLGSRDQARGDYLRTQQTPVYDRSIVTPIDDNTEAEGVDVKYDEAGLVADWDTLGVARATPPAHRL
jgi:S-DNA-T family DNA segregation ATPase FtsK/SpoIIIE